LHFLAFWNEYSVITGGEFLFSIIIAYRGMKAQKKKVHIVSSLFIPTIPPLSFPTPDKYIRRQALIRYPVLLPMPK
jgi:hypothetical protein